MMVCIILYPILSQNRPLLMTRGSCCPLVTLVCKALETLLRWLDFQAANATRLGGPCRYKYTNPNIQIQSIKCHEQRTSTLVDQCILSYANIKRKGFPILSKYVRKVVPISCHHRVTIMRYVDVIRKRAVHVVTSSLRSGSYQTRLWIRLVTLETTLHLQFAIHLQLEYFGDHSVKDVDGETAGSFQIGAKKDHPSSEYRGTDCTIVWKWQCKLLANCNAMPIGIVLLAACNVNGECIKGGL